ncbi:MAG: hypothetical protein AMXMBFR7_28620 [Planctomycetota bacterium]
MLIFYGIHEFSKKVTDKAQVFCKTCQTKVDALEHQSFNMAHLFFIPLIPLGTKKVWICPECGNDPHCRTRTSRAKKILLCILGLPMLGAIWFVEGKPEDTGSMWGVRAVFTVGYLILLYVTINHQPFVDSEDEGNSEPSA